MGQPLKVGNVYDGKISYAQGFVDLIQSWIMKKVLYHLKWMVYIVGYRINICWAKGKQLIYVM